MICSERETWESLWEEARMSPAFVQHTLEEKQKKDDGESRVTTGSSLVLVTHL